jgi:hypothetical protein
MIVAFVVPRICDKDGLLILLRAVKQASQTQGAKVSGVKNKSDTVQPQHSNTVGA